MNFLPSKKILSLLVIIIAFVASIMLAFGRGTKQVINATTALIPGEKIGLPENPGWQEDIELLQYKSNSSTTASTFEEEPTTLTDSLSQSLISNYLSMKQSGTLDADNATNLIDQSLEYIANSAPVSQISNLNLSSKNDVAAMKQYGEDLGKVLKSNRPKNPKNELEILTAIATNKDQSKIKELEEVNMVYRNILIDLSLIKVPKLFATSHLDMITGLNQVSSAISDMQIVLNDPIKGVVALETYKNGSYLFATPLQATIAYLKKNNVVYEQGSGGYYLLHGL